MSSFDTTPAMTPPEGETTNFVNPVSCGTKFLVVNCVFLPLAFIALSIRVWTRVFIVRGFRWDDALMIVAMILSCVLTGVTLEMLNWGLGIHMWNVPLSHLSPWFLKLNVVAAIFYCAATGFVKVSVLIFYTRIFPSPNFHRAVWVVVFIAIGYNVASVLANVFSCTPIAKSWDITITSGSCMNRPVFYFANAGLGIFTDFATVLLPIPWLRRLQMPLRQKIAVACILAMGCLWVAPLSLFLSLVLMPRLARSLLTLNSVGVVSCIRLATLYTLMESPDLTWATVDALLWCTIELNLGIIGGCVTALRPFVRRYFPRLLGLSSYSGGYPKNYPTASSRSRQYGHQLHSFPRNEDPDFSNHSHQYSTALKSGPDNSSEEHILNGTTPKGTDGIIRTVEFDVKNSETHP